MAGIPTNNEPQGNKEMPEHILTEKRDFVGRISINRVERHNSLMPDVMREIMEAVAAFDEDPEVRAILLTGEGRDFSVGGDYEALYGSAELSPSEIKNMLYKYFAGGVRAVYDCETPTVAAVRGLAYGAACELVVACDFRIVSETAKLCETWSNIGLTPALGGMFLVPRILGWAKACEVLLLGDPVSGAEAARIGLANKVVPDAELEDTALALAKRLASKPPLSVRAIKQIMRRGMETDFTATQTTGLFAQATLLKSKDYIEGLDAIREKRPPKFEGR